MHTKGLWYAHILILSGVGVFATIQINKCMCSNFSEAERNYYFQLGNKYSKEPGQLEEPGEEPG